MNTLNVKNQFCFNDWLQHQTRKVIDTVKDELKKQDYHHNSKGVMLDVETLAATAHTRCLSNIHLIQLIYQAIKNEEHASCLQLCAVMTIFVQGIKLLDDIADNELSAHWEQISPHIVTLIAFNLISVLPSSIISNMSVAEPVRVKLLHTIAKHFHNMIQGQELDLQYRNIDNIISVDDSLNIIRNKTGQWHIMCASLAAELAQGTDEAVGLYSQIAENYGMICQIANDTHDLFAKKESSDLTNGTRSFPITLYMNTLEENECTQFISLLQQAQTNLKIQDEIRQQLIDTGQLKFCYTLIELYRNQAIELLQKTSAKGFARDGLEEFINRAGHLDF